MTTGELWVSHPLFPWLLIILGFWVGCSTAAIIRNWVKIRRSEIVTNNSDSLVTSSHAKKKV